MSQNVLAVPDDFDDYDDWIEIYNSSNSAINIAGYYVTDNKNDLVQWQLPLNDPRTLIPANGYLILWADDQLDQGVFHMPFKLSDNETIVITTSDGQTIIDQIEIKNPEYDVSYGRYPDGTDSWGYILNPTPGTANLTNYAEFAPIPTFSASTAIYSNSFDVELNSDSDQDNIYFTLDGSEPDGNSQIYNQMITIDSTSVLRARIIKEGYAPGKIESAIYLIKPGHTLPILSIIISPEDLFDNTKGIYMNYLESGREWEKKCRLTFLDDDELFFSLNAGLRLQGNSGRKMDKKSFRLFFRNGYDNERLKYPLFGKNRINSFKNLVLRAGYDDDLMQSNGTLLRDPIVTELWKRMGNLGSQSKFTVLYLNNTYWGIYDIREDINDHFIEDYTNIFSPDIIRLRWKTWELEKGTSDEWLNLIDFFNINHFTSTSMYEEAIKRIDIESFTDMQVFYHLAQYYSWVYGAYIYKDNLTESKWQILIWDMDRAMNDVNWNGFYYYDNPVNQYWINIIIQKLLENDEYKKKFVNELCDNINTLFVPDNYKSVIDSLANVIEPEIINETIRWSNTYDNWIQNKSFLLNFAEQRSIIVLNQMKDYFGFSEPRSILFKVNNNGGSIKINSKEITQFPWTGQYFKEVPIKITAIPKSGYYFTGWSKPNLTNNPVMEMRLNNNDTLTAHFGKIEDNYLQVISPNRSSTGRLWPMIVRARDISRKRNINLSTNLNVDINGSIDTSKVVKIKKSTGTYVMNIDDTTDINVSLKNDEITTYSKNILIQNNYPIEEISGTLSSDNIFWTSEKDYLITGNLTIPSDCNLIIAKGTQVLLKEKVNIFIYGSLTITGDEYEPVIFIPENINKPWGGIEFYGSKSDIKYCFFIGAGADHSKNWGHAHTQCILFAKDYSELNLDNCFILDSPGKAIGSYYSKVNVLDCVTAFVFHGGEYLNTILHYNKSYIMNIPNDDGIFEDKDSDGFHVDYLYPDYKGYSIIENSYFLTGKDDAVDHHDTRLQVKNCYIDGWMHEGIAGSGGDTLKVFNTLIKNCEQGIEAGWTEGYNAGGPYVFADHCTVINNDIGLRFGDSYDWTYRGHLTVTNTILYNNDDNIWNYLNSTQAPKENAIDIFFSMTNDEEYNDSLNCITGTPRFDEDYFLLPGSDGFRMGIWGTNMGIIDTNGYIIDNLVINEIMYDSSNEFDSEDWIEIYNPHSYTINLSSWILQDENIDHEFKFPQGLKINPQSYLVVCRDSSTFSDIYSNVSSIVGNLNFGLGSSDKVIIYSSLGQLIDSVSYTNEYPWPDNCDGSGYSLSLKKTDSDNNVPDNWVASKQIGGSPGFINSDTSNAIAYHKPQPDKFLLYQNYPNPFNSQTQINFDVSETADITLTIYNVLGQKVKDEILNKTYNPGQYHYTFKSNRFASGIYFYRIKIKVNGKSKHTSSKKMLLLR